MLRFSRLLNSAVAAVLLLGASLAVAPKTAQAQITINFTVSSALASDPQSALITQAFQTAANNWTSQFANNFTLNLFINFDSLGSGILGETNVVDADYSYSTVRNALVADAVSADDMAAVASLPTGNSVPIYLNHTAENGNSGTPYLDNDGSYNNTHVQLSNANAKALGLLSSTATGIDAAITFSSDFRSIFDFDPSDGITSGDYDFVGIATHEIGHALGFISNVDTIDTNPGLSENFTQDPIGTDPTSSSYVPFISLAPTTLDLFRYSAASSAQSTPSVDMSADAREKDFSLNDGQGVIAAFSDGVQFGDGHQASHWKDNLGIGIMDPTAGQGEALSISENDLRAFDAIGYTRLKDVPITAPEPSTLPLILLASCSFAASRLRFRRNGSNR